MAAGQCRRKQEPIWVPLAAVGLMALMISLSSFDTSGQARTLMTCLGFPSLLLLIKLFPSIAETRRLRSLQMDAVDTMPGREFEFYVARLLQHQGFRTAVTPGSGDMGVDIIAERDGIRIAVQCKRYQSNLSRAAVSDVVAGKAHYHCTEAMVVTNSYFSDGAQQLARSTACLLIDRHTLTEWIADFQTWRKSQISSHS